MTTTHTTRFHTEQRDGLFRPIPFFFVTERMCEEILAERKLILEALPATSRKKQEALFARYDPSVSADAFSNVLSLFHGRPL